MTKCDSAADIETSTDTTRDLAVANNSTALIQAQLTELVPACPSAWYSRLN